MRGGGVILVLIKARINYLGQKKYGFNMDLEKMTT